MNQVSFTLILDSKKIQIPTRFSRLADVSTDIYNSLIFSPKHEYHIKSNVSEDVLSSFIQYWVKGETPDIRVENFTEFYELSEEFNLLKEQVQQDDDYFSSRLMYFKGLSTKINSNSSFYEEKISKQLDKYLEKYGQKIMELPIQTLYNIFSHQCRNLTDHNLAYSLIINEYQSKKNPEIFVLLKQLDGTKINQKNLNDSILNRNSRFGIMPYIQRKKETETKFYTLTEIVNEQQTKISKYTTEISSIKENEKQKFDSIKKTIKINTNQIEKIELKRKDISEIEKTQDNQNKTLKKSLQEQEQEISNLKKKDFENIEKIKDQLGNNLQEMRRLTERELKIPQRIQATRRFTKKEHNKKNPNKTIDLIYDSTESGRFKGIIHYLTEECKCNVHDGGAVEVTSSSVIPVLPILPGLPIIDDESHLPVFAVDLDDINSSFISDIRPNSWICYDFVDAKVRPNAYSIRSYVNGLSFLQCWCIEGSNDRNKWTILDERSNEHSIEDSGKSNIFIIQEKNINNYYRYIRLKQTGRNTKDNDSLCISAFELFGSFYE